MPPGRLLQHVKEVEAGRLAQRACDAFSNSSHYRLRPLGTGGGFTRRWRTGPLHHKSRARDRPRVRALCRRHLALDAQRCDPDGVGSADHQPDLRVVEPLKAKLGNVGRRCPSSLTNTLCCIVGGIHT